MRSFPFPVGRVDPDDSTLPIDHMALSLVQAVPWARGSPARGDTLLTLVNSLPYPSVPSGAARCWGNSPKYRVEEVLHSLHKPSENRV